MRQRFSIQRKPAALLSWKQRLIALLLFILSSFLVMDPIWECRDHLDNLRHLGPHGMLVILLLVACAGISLLKTFQWIGFLLVALIAGDLRPFSALRPSSELLSASATFAVPPPLRI